MGTVPPIYKRRAICGADPQLAAAVRFLLYEFVSVPQPQIEKTKMKNSKKTGPSRSESIPSPEKSNPVPAVEEIRKRAYEIFLARDSSAGDAASDWFHAERELKQKRPRAV